MKFENRLGYRFSNGALLEAALTHPSFAAERHCEHYQRLEFLGDAVLELVASHLLFERHPRLAEGELTRMRASHVCEESLSRAARALGLGNEIRLSAGESKSGGAGKPSILADVMEAVIGAVYLDGGLAPARAIIEKCVFTGETPEPERDAKSRLQELAQKRGMMPSYEQVSLEGPPHEPEYAYRAILAGEVVGEGRGHSKQAAQQEAARRALERLK